jgi:DMSO/TMAO reductase YedYZ molybdopterin-dependent catalytic subunit
VRAAGEYKLTQIQALPRLVQNTRHVCIEGWDVIGNFGGARISDFLRLVGADPAARFVEVGCADDYYESLDMESAMHPQSLLCYEMYGKAARSRARCSLAPPYAYETRIQAGQVPDFAQRH